MREVATFSYIYAKYVTYLKYPYILVRLAPDLMRWDDADLGWENVPHKDKRDIMHARVATYSH